MAKKKVETKSIAPKVVEKISITKLHNTSYQAYARYVVYNRAIPSLRDGFKTVQRKVFFTSQKHLKGDNSIKVSAIGGYAIAESHYAHGDSAINDAIITMTQSFKQSLPYFLPDGDFGSLYAPKAGAPRYISLYKSDVFDLLFKDNELLIKQYSEGDLIEPEYYLPIVPTVLINSTGGIAIGYASSINNRNALRLIDEVLKYVKTGKIKPDLDILPFVHGAIGKWVYRINKKGERQYEHHGFMEIVNTTTVKITGIPCGLTFETFEKNLNTLIDSEYCVEWINRSGKDQAINYEIKFSREQLTKHKKEGTLENKLKIITKIEKENATVLDVDGTIKRFNNESEIIQRFVDWRLPFVETRRQNQMMDIKKAIQFNLDKLRFIKLVNAGKIKVKEFKSRKEAENVLKTFDLPVELVDIKLYSISAEEIARLEAKNLEHEKTLKVVEATTAQKMYISDLNELIKGVEKMGYIRDEFETINES